MMLFPYTILVLDSQRELIKNGVVKRLGVAGPDHRHISTSIFTAAAARGRACECGTNQGFV